MVVIPGRQTSGPIAAFLRLLPPSQPDEEAKAQAASLAATAAAAAQQQDITVHAGVQVGRGWSGRGQGTASSREALLQVPC